MSSYLTLADSHPLSFRPFWDNFSPFEALFTESRDFWPNFEVEDKEKEYLFTLPLAGFKREEVTVEVDRDNMLNVKAEKSSKAKHLGITRSLSLGGEVDPETVTAKLEDGVLTVTAQKRDLPKPRQIAIA